jgi:hypothetical protein
MSHHITLRGWFVIHQVYDAVSTRPGLRRLYNPANIVPVDTVKHLSLALDNARGAITQAVKRATSGTINTSGTKYFSIKQLLPSLLSQ